MRAAIFDGAPYTRRTRIAWGGRSFRATPASARRAFLCHRASYCRARRWSGARSAVRAPRFATHA